MIDTVDKCSCECKEWIDKGRCDDGFIRNPGAFECECNKSCDVGEYSDYVNCKCRIRIIHKLVEECEKGIDGNEWCVMELCIITEKYADLVLGM